MSSLLVRRLLLPQILLLSASVLAVVVYVAVHLYSADTSATASPDPAEGRLLALAEFALLVLLAASAAAAFVTWTYARRRGRQVVETFRSKLPRDQRARPPATLTQPPSADLTQLLDAIAESFGLLIAQAAEDQSQLRTIITSMSDGLVAVDQHQRLLLANRAAEQLLAFRIPATGGTPLGELIGVPSVHKAATEVMLTGEPRRIEAGPVQGRHLEVFVRRLPTGDRPPGLLIVAHDVTEAKAYQDLRKEFVANVSHELRTPLTLIKGFIETLEDGALDERPRAVQYLATMRRHANQLSNLVEDLLNLSRLESSSRLPDRHEIDLVHTLRHAAELLEPAAQRKNQSLVCDVPDDLPPILGSHDDLQRAILNLLDNAIKYTPEGGRIRLTARVQDGSVMIDVSDTGIGIAAEDLPRIFERFYRVDRSRSKAMGGTGLGLSIVKHVIQSHGGSIDAESQVGAGTTFHVRLSAQTAASTPFNQSGT